MLVTWSHICLSCQLLVPWFGTRLEFWGQWVLHSGSVQKCICASNCDSDSDVTVTVMMRQLSLSHWGLGRAWSQVSMGWLTDWSSGCGVWISLWEETAEACVASALANQRAAPPNNPTLLYPCPRGQPGTKGQTHKCQRDQARGSGARGSGDRGGHTKGHKSARSKLSRPLTHHGKEMCVERLPSTSMTVMHQIWLASILWRAENHLKGSAGGQIYVQLGVIKNTAIIS